MKQKVELTNVIKSGNAFAMMGAFRVAAEKAGWTNSEIEEVLDNAMSSDYDHLLDVILSNCEETARPDEVSFDYDDYDNDVHFDDYDHWR